jgi:hypothetical protein
VARKITTSGGPVWSDLLSEASLNKRLTEAVNETADKPVFARLIAEPDLTPMLEYVQQTR